MAMVHFILLAVVCFLVVRFHIDLLFVCSLSWRFRAYRRLRVDAVYYEWKFATKYFSFRVYNTNNNR